MFLLCLLPLALQDANDYLNEIAQGNPQNINEFRVMAVSMEKVMKKIQGKKQSRKLGRYKMQSVIRIQPSSRQCENAERVVAARESGKGGVGKGSAAVSLRGVSIPMFTAKGLSLRRANGEVVVPFYFALEVGLGRVQSRMQTLILTRTYPFPFCFAW